jgi:ketosteroid isomerase-like protein
MPQDRADLVRRCFAAYATKDRGLIEGILSDDFTFTSPYDDRIDRAAYFVRCWPNSDRIRTNRLEKVVVDGDDAFVLYQCTTTEGNTFRNTELFRFEGDRVREVQVYFGASYRDGRFVRKA